MNKTILKVVEQKHYDRYVFLTYYNDEIVGLNFHQGIDKIMYDFAQPCPALTDIFERYSEKYPELNWDERVNKAIDIYLNAFILQHENISLPNGQKYIIQEALNYYLDQFIKFNDLTTNESNWKVHDLRTLIALMKYDVQISLSKHEVNEFSFKNGIDLPIYNN
jgi:hypothetical protein